MNPTAELDKLIHLFPGGDALFAGVEHVPSALVPEPYRAMLVHDQHMTVTMERHYGAPVDVRILDRRLDGDVYCRKIVLVLAGTERVVQFGIVRFDLRYADDEVREEILRGETPLGRVLIEHDVMRHIDLGAVLKITAGPGLAAALAMPEGGVTYGRLATIFCDGRPAVDLLEIPAPLEKTADGR